MSINLKKFKFLTWNIAQVNWNRDRLRNNQEKPIRVWNRRSFLEPSGSIQNYLVHKGNRWLRIKYSKLKNSSKIGEFAFTRKPFYHPYNKKKKK